MKQDPSSGPAAPGWAALLSGANGVRSLALGGGVALHAINLYIGTTILPSIVQDIGGMAYYAWNTSLFVLASILGAAVVARLLQRMGPGLAYAAAAAVFGLGAVACAAAPSMPVMLLGRFVQGLGGGLLLALPYAMIRLVFDESLWPRAMALISGMWGVATLVGPAVGGVFAELGMWRAAFWSLLPFTLLFTVLALAVLPRQRTAQTGTEPLPVVQLGLLTAAVLAISAGSLRGEAVWNVAGVAVAAGLGAALVRIEARAAVRLLPRGALNPSTPLGRLYLTMALLAVTVTCSEVFAPLFLQILHGLSPLKAGYMAALMSAAWTAGSVASSGSGAQRIRLSLVLAPVFAVVGMLALAVLLPRSAGEAGWALLTGIGLGMSAVGIGVGLAWPHLATRVLQVAPGPEQDLASASITTVQLCATALSTAVAGLVTNLAGLSTAEVPGVSNAALWLFAVFAAAPAWVLVMSMARPVAAPASAGGVGKA